VGPLGRKITDAILADPSVGVLICPVTGPFPPLSDRLVQDLVDHVLGAGVWLDQQQANRDKAVAIAAGRDYFNQDPKILKFVMENPTDRVTYGDLRMIRDEFDDLMRLSIEAGTIKHEISYEKYVDERFARQARAAAIAI